MNAMQKALRSSSDSSVYTPFDCEGPSLTVQSGKDEADINVLVKRFGLTGELPQNVRIPLEGDFTDAMDYREAMDAIRAADVAFAAMPADVRSRFGNDPAQFMDFTQAVDDKGGLANLDEMRKLGLAVPAPVVVPPVEVPPMRVVVVPEK